MCATHANEVHDAVIQNGQNFDLWKLGFLFVTFSCMAVII